MGVLGGRWRRWVEGVEESAMVEMEAWGTAFGALLPRASLLGDRGDTPLGLLCAVLYFCSSVFLFLCSSKGGLAKPVN